MNNKQITFFIPNMKIGGAERSTYNTIMGFYENGYHIALLLLQKEGYFITKLPTDIEIFCVSSINNLFIFKHFIILCKLWWYVITKKLYTIISTWVNCNVYSILIKILTLKKVKTILLVRTIESQRNQNIFRKLIKPLYPLSDKIIAVSNDVAQDLINNYQIRGSIIHVINNPIDIKEINKFILEEPADNYIFNNDYPVIISMGKFIKLKGFDTLIKAFKLVRMIMPSILIILGDGDEKYQIKKLIKEFNLEDDVILPGYKTNPFAYLKYADIFVLPSRLEGFGNVLIEAMACGCQIVATNCPGGPKEILEEGKWGKIVPVDDYRTMAQAIIDLINNPLRTKEEMISRATQFDKSIIINQYLRLVESL